MKKTIYLFATLLCLFASCEKEDPSDNVPEEVEMETLLEESMTLTLNPYGICPLSAVIEFSSIDETTVELEICGDEPIERSFTEAMKGHKVPVYGLYPGTTNQVIIKITNDALKYAYDTLSIETGSIPEFFPTIDVSIADPDKMERGMTMAMFSIGNAGLYNSYPFMIDDQGTVRWYLDLSQMVTIASPGEGLQNGNLLFAAKDTIIEVSFVGERINEWILEGYHQHHDVIEKPNGNLVVAVAKEGLSTTDDFIVELDRSSGSIVNTWDMRQILDIDRYDLTENAFDWFHMNAIWYDESDDCLIISGRNQGMLKVNADNELQWILAPHKGWGKAGIDGDGFETSDYLLTAIDQDGNPYSEAVQLGDEEPEDFTWPWGQHAPMLLPNGNLFYYNNGFNRQFTGDNLYSQGVEYIIDEENMTVQQVWEYGKTRGDDFYSVIISDVDLMPETSNRLITSGWCTIPDRHAIISEVTYPSKELVFDVRFTFKDMFGSGEFGWGQMDVCYRAERIKW